MSLPDPAKYRHLLNDPSLTDERKDELILGMWGLMEGLFKKIMSGQIPTVPTEGAPTSDTKPEDSVSKNIE